jgi:signal transduction histidine kinase
MIFLSIKSQAMILLLLVMTIPLLLVGFSSSFYYRNALKNDIWDYNLAQAKTISTLTSNYLDLSIAFLESQSERPSVIKALKENDIISLNMTMQYIQEKSPFYAVYMTDTDGIVIASYPYYNIIGRDDSSLSYVNVPLKNNVAYINDPMISPVRKKPVIYTGIPVEDNGRVLGVIVGALDLMEYSDFVLGSLGKNKEYTFLVNSSGNVFVHNNMEYMDNMKDFNVLYAVQKVLQGNEGIIEEYDPIDNKELLTAYAPVKKYGLGVVVSLPIDVAYKPINDITDLFLFFIGFLVLLSSIIAAFIGKYFVEPILKMAKATSMMPDGNYQEILPLNRKDEMGVLARSMDRLNKELKSDRDGIRKAKNIAEDEKRRAELYVDIMGHDINNLNQTALSSLELLLLDKNMPEEQKNKLINNALLSIQGSAGIIDNVRKIQRITSDKLDLEKVDINEMIKACIKEAHPAGKVVNITYNDDKEMYVKGISLLKEAFCNLIDNSIKYSGSVVNIVITAGEKILRDRCYYEVIVEDDGIGIPDDMKAKVFNRSQRGDTKVKGTGMGLYIVRALVERFGGSIGVENRVDGDYTKGTKFIMLLPSANGDECDVR